LDHKGKKGVDVALAVDLLLAAEVTLLDGLDWKKLWRERVGAYSG
jgi:hypothetical protein